MYVDTLITLQENLATYAAEGKKITGHVTINSPGMIKCYIQNLKELNNGNEYILYAFSKAKNKGVRIGKLGKNKETKWMVSEKNIQSSGLKLEDLDAVAIVFENDMRGADTVAMGFKNNRYIIVPMIDNIVKTMQGNQEYNVKEYTSASNNITTKANIVKPAPIIKGPNPVSPNNKSSTQYSLKESNQWGITTTNIGNGASVDENSIGNGASVDENSIGNGASVDENSIGNGASVDKNSIGNGASIDENSIGNGASVDEDSIGNGASVDENSIGNTTNNVGNSNNMAYGNSNNDYSYSTGGKNNTHEPEMPINVNNNNMGQTNQTIEQSNFKKEPILSSGTQNNSKGESIEDNESILIKIAEKLQEIENNPTVIKGVNVAMPITKGKSSQATTVKDPISENDSTKTQEEIDAITEKTAKELERIIARLKADQTINDKIQEIEQQLTRLHNEENESKAINKSNIEQKIESGYIQKQTDGYESKSSRETYIKEIEVDEIEVESPDTSPRNALSFIQDCIKTLKEKGLQSIESSKKPLMDKHQSVQEEIDYISQIDRKIKEIEERRNQERNLK